MAKMIVRLFNAERQQLDDLVDLNVIDTRTNTTRAQFRRERGRKVFAIEDLRPTDTYLVQAFPLAHRPVQQFSVVKEDVPTNVHLFCPIHPDRARPTPVRPAVRPAAACPSWAGWPAAGSVARTGQAAQGGSHRAILC